MDPVHAKADMHKCTHQQLPVLALDGCARCLCPVCHLQQQPGLIGIIAQRRAEVHIGIWYIFGKQVEGRCLKVCQLPLNNVLKGRSRAELAGHFSSEHQQVTHGSQMQCPRTETSGVSQHACIRTPVGAECGCVCIADRKGHANLHCSILAPKQMKWMA